MKKQKVIYVVSGSNKNLGAFSSMKKAIEAACQYLWATEEPYPTDHPFVKFMKAELQRCGFVHAHGSSLNKGGKLEVEIERFWIQ